MRLQILCALLIPLLSCTTTPSSFVNEKYDPDIRQDISKLTDKDGLIVYQEKVHIVGFEKIVDCYKIKYLSDGLKVVGYIVKPQKHNELPVIIYNRPGNREWGKIDPHGGKGNIRLNSLCYMAKGLKSVVIASQYRGNDGGEGKDQFGGDDVNDVLNLIPLSTSLDFVDPNRISMVGYSRGGMMTYLALKENPPLRAAIVVGAVTNLKTHYENRDRDYKETIKELVGIDDDEFRKRSAIYWADKINTPLLILHGLDDKRVSVDQARALSTKLTELNKTARLIVYREGDHLLETHLMERNKDMSRWLQLYTY